ncbi:electron transfer flavoprotein subunit alpha/FixB family protein [Marinomonas pollencensis]|uniref:Electron transfer flavoprotein alpha subunit apoprotein n=1 Tax=Marinomonas pollencensis TaxID=491954 RepID=A0A3E0DFS9_9GAMM|nr:electron transfer flavoprotein subunit alpha/FixB family protein [Marinomonas pollencensis]REG81587.1 electron transfer flavoprotein alpha subunit apoprotein [Marinomonas pollencensis]
MNDFSSVAVSPVGVVRRDPRKEWMARNRLHPRHHEVISEGVGGEMGANGLMRRNPRQIGFIGPNGIKRIDRLKGNAVQTPNKRQSVVPEVVLPWHVVATADFYIFVVPDMVGGRLSGHDKDILGLAHRLQKEIAGQGAVVAVCFGEVKETQFELAGVDRLVHFAGAEFEGFAAEAKAAALAAMDERWAPKHWLFPDSIHGGTDLGSRLAAELGERPATQAWQVDLEKTVARGAGGSLDISRATPRILFLLEECAYPIDETRHQVLSLEMPEVQRPAPRLLDQGLVAVDPNEIPLAEAEFILSAGNGIHNWAQFHQTAKALGATEGASRVAVDDGFMPRSRQVGASGTWVTARVYIAVGISGAIQHLQGIAQCDKIIAINTDAGCDMVKRANLAVIDDSDAILSALMMLANEKLVEPGAVQGNTNKEDSDAA